MLKTILIAIATERYIEAETLKRLWDLQIPSGYRADFQYVTGDQIDQTRNQIATQALDYDYLFSVDSDIVLPSDALIKMLAADVDMISGLYIQRKPEVQILEVYKQLENGAVVNIPYAEIENRGVVEIAAAGFGCVLIRCDVIRKMTEPYFVYHSALDHAHTVSEDVYFCMQARKLGFKIWADSSIKCDHIGSTTYSLITPAERRLEQLYHQPLLPESHVRYLGTMNIAPNVIYDVGACVLHWTNPAKRAWPNAQFYLFDALEELRSLYNKLPYPYHLGVLGECDSVDVKFYKDVFNPGGNSRFKENSTAYNETHATLAKMFTLDTVVQQRGFPLPDLIKLDVQGAEISVLQGAKRCLAHCTDVILEAQHVDYNQGAPKAQAVIEYMHSVGFDLVANFTKHAVDGDYHFKRRS